MLWDSLPGEMISPGHTVVDRCFGSWEKIEVGRKASGELSPWSFFFCSVIPLCYTAASGDTVSLCCPGGAEVKTMRSNQIDLENKVILPGCPRKARGGMGHRWPLWQGLLRQGWLARAGEPGMSRLGETLLTVRRQGFRSSATRRRLLDAVNFIRAFK